MLFMNKILTILYNRCYTYIVRSIQHEENAMSQLTLNQKLASLQPLVDLALFESSLAYRNKILCVLAEQEQTLNSINKEFGHAQPEGFGSEKKFVLGYN